MSYPTNWTSTPLGDVAEVLSGFAFKSKDFNTDGKGMPLVRIRDVVSGATGTYFSGDFDRRFIVRRGDILVGMDGDFNRSRWASEDALLNQRVCKVSAITGIDDGYLFHLLPQVLQVISDRTPFVTVKHLSAKELKEYEIPLPPLEEQKRIAGILDQAAELCRLRTRALDKLGTLGQAIFHEMFVGDTSDSWPRVQVEHFAKNMRTGPFGSQLLHSEFVDHGIPVLGIDNAVSNEFRWAKERFITVEKYEQLKRFTVLPGDVLITIMGTCGRCAVVPEDIPTAINTKHLCCITVDRAQVLPEFLQAAFLHHPEVLRQLGIEAKGAVMPGMNMGIIKALKLPLPPLSLQGDFGERLKEITVSQAQARTAQKSTETLFASLQHRAFRGEL